MKRFIFLSIGLCMLASVPVQASAQKSKRLGCFVQVNVPAKYSVKKIKIKDSYRQYVKRTNGQIDLMEYPAVYREEKKLIAGPEIIMRQVACKGAPVRDHATR